MPSLGAMSLPALRPAALSLGLALPSAMAAAPMPDCVVLLHGLWRSDTSMVVMQEALELEGYRVVNSDYVSTADPVADLAAAAIPPALEACGDAPRIHFVTHSLGGILLRVWSRDHGGPPDRIGRTVMLGPPNQGSELVDALSDLAPFAWINGPAGLQLGTRAAEGLPATLPPVWPGVGVIAGDRSLNPIYSAILPGPDDGKVTVHATRVDGMEDHVTLPVTHTFMASAPVVIAQVTAFLRDGRFAGDVDTLDALGALADGVIEAVTDE